MLSVFGVRGLTARSTLTHGYVQAVFHQGCFEGIQVIPGHTKDVCQLTIAYNLKVNILQYELTLDNNINNKLINI